MCKIVVRSLRSVFKKFENDFPDFLMSLPYVFVTCVAQEEKKHHGQQPGVLVHGTHGSGCRPRSSIMLSSSELCCEWMEDESSDLAAST
jgi:hypothetical protein